MFPYLAVTTLIAFAAVLFPQRRPGTIAWYLTFVLLVLFIGLRHKVGMDWNNYVLMSRLVNGRSLADSMDVGEPAFALLLWLSVNWGFGVYGANLVGALIFCTGLFRYARTTPLPWVALLVAMPILVVVVAMSANRQAIAIGILLWLCASWPESSVGRRIAFTIAAAMFHFSAIFFLMFCALGLKMHPGYRVVLGVVLGMATIAFLQLTGGGEYYGQTYVTGQSAITYSAGATQHVMLNGGPAVLLILTERLREKLFPNDLHRQMAALAILLVPAAFFYSVAAGRMSLYLFPVSMYTLAALPGLFREAPMRALLRTTIAAVMCGILAFWLTFSNSSSAHIPYDNALLMDASRLHL